MRATDQRILQAIVSGTLTDAQRRAITDIVAGGVTDNDRLSLLLSQAQAARALNISRFTFYRLEKLGKVKPIFLTADLKRYRRSDIEMVAAVGFEQDQRVEDL